MLTEIKTGYIEINPYPSHYMEWEIWRYVVDSLKLRMRPISEYELMIKK